MSEERRHDLHHFMQQLSTAMDKNYEYLKTRVGEDPGTTGDQAEIHWAKWLSRWLPPTYKVVTKGRIINQNGEASPQVDVLVLKSFYPKELHTNKHYLSAGVAAAFECKTTLEARYIKEATQICVEIKNLYRNRKETPDKETPYRELHTPIVYGLLAHSHIWKGEGATPEDNITRNLSESDVSYVSHPRLGLDFLCVADCGTWVLSKFPFSYGSQSVLPPELQDGVDSGHLPHTPFLEQETEDFTPIGSFYANLMERLAWEDPTLRDIVDYLRATKIGGEGGGQLRRWTFDILSDAVQKQIREGRRLSNDPLSWDEWKNNFGIRMQVH